MESKKPIEEEVLRKLTDVQLKHLLKNSDLKFCSHEFFNKMKLNSRYMNLLVFNI